MELQLQVTLFKGDGTSESQSSGVESLASFLLGPGGVDVADTERDDEASDAEAAAAAVSIRELPVLSFDFFSLHSLWRSLSSPAQFAGLILTSPRCVESLAKVCHYHCRQLETQTPTHAENANADGDADTSLLLLQTKEAWARKPVFCVGPSTAAKYTAFTGAGTSPPPNIVLSPDGNAESLGQAIIKEHEKRPILLPLLYPCGTLKRDTLATLLTAANVPFECLTVYRTVRHPDLEKSIDALNNEMAAELSSSRGRGRVFVFVFYSPSGVQHALPLLQHLCTAYVVAIGPTTKAALEEKMTPERLFQCSAPTNEALAQVLRVIRAKIVQ